MISKFRHRRVISLSLGLWQGCIIKNPHTPNCLRLQMLRKENKIVESWLIFR